MSSSSPSKEGWLWKVGGSIQSWKKRWMVLSGRQLSYFKENSGFGTACGSISLDGSSVSALPANNEHSSPSTQHATGLFGITPPNSARMYVIQAPNANERDAWIAACTLAGAFEIKLNELSSKTQPHSLLEGWLDKQSSSRFGLFGGSVERVYAALFVDKLAVWKSVQTSSAPAEQVLLCAESHLVPGWPTNPFELTGRKGEAKWTLVADTPAQKEDWIEAIALTIKGQRYEHPPYAAAASRASVAVRGNSVYTGPPIAASASAPPAPPSPASVPSAAFTATTSPNSHQSTKLKNRHVTLGDSDDDDDGPPPPPPGHARSGTVDEEDEGSEDDDMHDVAAAKNADIQEAVDFASDDEEPPPPPATDADDSEEPPPPPPMPAAIMAGQQSESLLAQQPDVLLQLRALLSSRFADDPAAMQAYLASFSKEVLEGGPAPALPEEPETPLGTRRMTSKLTKMLVSNNSIPYTRRRRMLHVHLLEARDLAACDSNGFSDPYAVLHIRGVSQKKKDSLSAPVKSKTISESLDPLWDQQMTLDLPPDALELVCDLYDFDRFSTDDFIGRAVIPLQSLQGHHAGVSGWYALGGMVDSWATVGSVFIGAVIDEHVVEIPSRNAPAFRTARAQCLLAQEQQHFAAHFGPVMPLSPPASPIPSSSAASAPSPFPNVTTLSPTEKLRVWIGTWNAGNAAPPDDLSPFIPLYTADIYAIGTQECEYAPRRDNKSCKVDWQCCLVRHFGRDYTLVRYHSLWEIRIAVFVANRLLPFVTNVNCYHEATGIGNLLGNKGGAIVSLHYKHLKLCFVNSHLAAHQNMTELRNQNYRTIVRNVRTGPSNQSDLLNQFHHVAWMGDLNYRLAYGTQGDAKSPSLQLFDEMVNRIEHGGPEGLVDLWSKDQLVREMKASKAFIGFREGTYNFPPTFKVKRNSGLEYTPQRSPAWCDRILTRSVPGFPLEQLSLAIARTVHTSDHKPVVSMLELEVAPTAPPLDRGLGETVIRVHDIRCTLLRAHRDIKEKELDPAVIAQAKDLDPQLVFNGSFLVKPIVTGVVRKASSPQWLELPPAPATINEVRRIRQSLLYVRVLNHQSQDAIVGRGIISLHELAPIPNEDGSLPSCAESRGRQHSMRFDTEITFAGMPAGNITGQISLMWKAKAKATK